MLEILIAIQTQTFVLLPLLIIIVAWEKRLKPDGICVLISMCSVANVTVHRKKMLFGLSTSLTTRLLSWLMRVKY